MLGRKHRQPSSPTALEASAMLTPIDLSAISADSPAADILRQLDAAAKKQAEQNAILNQIIPVRKNRVQQITDPMPRSGGGAGMPPPTNRGGKCPDEALPPETVQLVLEDGVVKQVPKRRTWGGSAATIDWVSFTFAEESIQNGETVDVTDFQVLVTMSNRLESIFGYGITSQCEKGKNFYRESYVIGDDYGFVCHGGQRGTVLVMLNGHGCAAAKPEWEIRLKAFLDSAVRGRITRVDLAHDDYSGLTYSVDRADMDHTNGLFNCGGRNPDCEYRGNWKNPNGKGRTFNVGNRKNGKFCRVYEKGRELGDKNSEWVRIEVEFKSVDRLIPFDILLHPGAYLAKAYPAFSFISQHQERIETTQKTVQANFEKAVAWMRHQCGAYVHNISQLVGVDQFIRLVSRDDKVPAAFKVPHFSLAGESIHHRERENHPVDLHAAALAW